LSFVDWYYGDWGADPSAWRESAEQELRDHRFLLDDPKMTGEHLEFAAARAAELEYRLEHDIRPEHGTMWGGILGAAGLVYVVTLFTIIVAGDSLAGEFATGTIKLLLIRPANRTKILLSKYFASLLFGLLLLAVLFVVSVLANGVLYRFQYFN